MSRSRTRTPLPPPENFPAFCDFSCEHAKFAPAELSGACRKDQTIYCRLFTSFNTKHRSCLGTDPARCAVARG